MDVTGTWEGEYIYGSAYGESAGVRVPFKMSLSSAPDGRVRGYVRDDAAAGGQPEQGLIQGRTWWRRLRFVKSMPRRYALVAGELVDLRVQLEQDHGIVSAEPMPRHLIEYRGWLRDGGETVAGQWSLPAWDWHTEEGVLHFPVGGTGTWLARRVARQPSEV